METKILKGIKVGKGTNQKKVEFNLSSIVSHLTSPDGTKDYILKVNDKGELYLENANGSGSGESSSTAKTFSEAFTANGSAIKKDTKVLPKILINSFFCGGNDDENSLNYCSHNFIELSNAYNFDVKLDGLSIQYTGESGNDWNVFPLSGIIKAGSTFLIRGAQCSDMDSPITKIKIENYDMEWKNAKTANQPIKFSTGNCKFYLAFTSEACSLANPYKDGVSNDGIIGYVDLVGVHGSANTGVDGFEGTAYSGLNNKRIFKRVYSMDPGAKAIKGFDKRSNVNDWNYVELSKDNGENVRNVEIYKPCASSEGKTMFYDKTKMLEGKPSMITCSFGIQATADTTKGATRCFNWIADNINCGNLWVRKQGENWGSPYKAYLETDDVLEPYKRQILKYSNGENLIVNKYILRDLTAGTYEYVAGKMDENSQPDMDYCTPIHTFKVRNSADVTNFKFVQTSDQQGFTWDEYRVWESASKIITKENNDLHFMINTGDMTQDGNRMYEWLDYFDAKGDLSDMEEMATIGNNDLSHRVLTEYSNGNDNDKVWLQNITFFYTFEIDETNKPLFTIKGNDYWVPSLYSFNYGNVHFMCMNSEIKKVAEIDDNGIAYGFGTYGNFYPKIKEWAEKDIENSTATWNIAYCHDMPFTVVTKSNYEGADTAVRGGSNASSLNENNNSVYEVETNETGGTKTTLVSTDTYWFSEFCQKHDIRLVIGGHKHTQMTTYPLRENVTYDGENRIVKSMKPIIVVTSDLLSSDFEGATSLVTVGNSKYPDTWVENGSIKAAYVLKAKNCTFMMKSDIPSGEIAVVYAMSQSTSYKHSSNKELPCIGIPWMRYYHPSNADNDKSNKTQKYPFYTIWEISENSIKGHVRKVYGIFNDSGKFDINIDWPYVKQGKIATTSADNIATKNDHSEPIHSVNGISSSVNLNDTTTIIEITK